MVKKEESIKLFRGCKNEKKWILILSCVFSIGFLSGCNAAEDILDEVMSFLNGDSTAEEENADEDIEEAAESGEEGSPDEEAVESEQDNRSDDDTDASEEDAGEEIGKDGDQEETADSGASPELPFDDLLISQGYTFQQLPNGFPFEVPYHWILVESSAQDMHDHSTYEAKFCFDLPLEIEQIANHFQFFDEVTQEHHGIDSSIIHTTTFGMDFGFDFVNGMMEYYLDANNNTCANLVLAFGEGSEMDSDDDNPYGEDPDSMVSEEELAEMKQRARERANQLPAAYLRGLEELRNNPLAFPDTNEVTSIGDKIKNGEVDMIHLSHGHPRIFPYEWYLVEMNEDHYSGSWNGKFCTDAPLAQTLVKHHDMLLAYYPDITNYLLNNPFDSEEHIPVEFAFNDDYGTGSWHGMTEFFIDQGEHKCATVSMAFSSEIIPPIH